MATSEPLVPPPPRLDREEPELADEADLPQDDEQQRPGARDGSADADPRQA